MPNERTVKTVKKVLYFEKKWRMSQFRYKDNRNRGALYEFVKELSISKCAIR